MRDYYYLGGRRGLTRLSTGQMFIVNTDARDIATWIIHLGQWEINVDDILCALARPGDTFVDVGANMGYYTIKIGGKIGPQGRIFAFEPNGSLFDVLRDNVRINGFESKARLFQAAAGEGAGQANLSFDRNYPGGGHLKMGAEPLDPAMTTIEAAVVGIDDVVDGGRVDLVKIDVEGFEPMVLKGMAATLDRQSDAAVVTEVSWSQWARFGDPKSLLQGFAGDRRIFIIRPAGTIEELPEAQLETALNRPLPSYLLLLPRTAVRARQVQRFIRPYAPLAPGDYGPPSARRPSLLMALRRMMRGF